MIQILFITFILIIAIILFSLAWRYSSRRRSLPCPVWMKWMLDPPSFKGISSRTKKTIEHLQVSPGMSVLDAGCGPGRLSIPLAERIAPNGVVTAMDIQEKMLDEVRKRSEKKVISNIRYLQGGIGEGKLEHNSFDRIVMITVLGEIPERETAMKELYNALKSGGKILIEETIRDPHFQRASVVREYAKKVGLIEVGHFGSRFNYIIIFERP